MTLAIKKKSTETAVKVWVSMPKILKNNQGPFFTALCLVSFPLSRRCNYCRFVAIIYTLLRASNRKKHGKSVQSPVKVTQLMRCLKFPFKVKLKNHLYMLSGVPAMETLSQLKEKEGERETFATIKIYLKIILMFVDLCQ